MELAVESLEKNWNEMIRLAVDHWHETEMYRHGQEFAPSYDRYVQYERAGWLFMVIARDKGEMVGYCIMYLTPSMHTQKTIATEDTYFLLPSHRKGRNALNLLKFAEDECRKRGAIEVIMTAKLTNNAGRILELRGYTEVAKQYSKQFNADSVQTTST